MLKHLIFISFLFFFLNSIAQPNLVKNPSFEEGDSCVTGVEIFGNHVWSNPTSATPDLFAMNSCSFNFIQLPYNSTFGYQMPRTGIKCAGLIPYQYNGGQSHDYREYLQGNLLSELVANQTYYVEFYACLADNQRQFAVKLSAHFVKDSLEMAADTGSNFLNNPRVLFFADSNITAGNYITDYVNWTKISGYYTASGGEKYIEIGNFAPQYQTDTLPISPIPSGAFTTYYFIDDVTVYESEIPDNINELSNNRLNLYPNPAADFVNIALPQNAGKTTLKVYNIQGQLLMQKQVTTTYVDVAELSNGLYTLTLENDKGIIGRNRLMIAR